MWSLCWDSPLERPTSRKHRKAHKCNGFSKSTATSMNWQKQGVTGKQDCRQTLLIILQKSRGKEHRFYTYKDSGDAHVTDRRPTGAGRRAGALNTPQVHQQNGGKAKQGQEIDVKKITSHLTRSQRALTLCLCQLRWPLALSRSLTWWPRVTCLLKSPLWTLRGPTDAMQCNVTSLITVVQ